MSAFGRSLYFCAWLLAGVICGVTLAAPTRVYADPVTFGPYDLRSVFHVEKSENQNQVHYGIRLDELCRPVGKNPVFAYWRRLKSGQRVDDPLVGAGTRVYGASTDQKVQLAANGGRVQMYVRALERLVVDVEVQKTNGACVATPTVTLHGERAKLQRAFLQLGRLGITVKYVDVYGLKQKDGQPVMEQFR